MLHWFKSYLSNRLQRVQFMGSSSDWAAVHSGVPQGAVLAPILFNIFAFDLPFCIQSNLRQYADDTVLYRVIKNQDDEVALQDDLQHINTWCNLNCMSLNPNKCKLMTVTRSRNPAKPLYKIAENTLENVDSYKYLGVIISRDLSWKTHVNKVSSKATRLNGFIGRVVKTRNPYILTLLYRSISRPILEYAAPVWCPVLSTQQKTLEKVQRRFTRFCLGLPRRVLIDSVNEIEYSDRCVKLGLPLLINRVHFLSITFVIKCLYNKFDIDTDTLIPINCRHIESVKFVHHRARSNAAHHSLFHRFPRLWDELPACIKDTIIHSLSSFTNSLRNHLLVPGEEVPLTKTV